MTLHRLREWPERLEALLKARENWTFEWGVHDCCSFAADSIQAITDVDIMADLRGNYQTALQAHYLTHEMGGLEAIVTARLGPPVSPALCTVGDVMLIRNEARELLSICNGSTVIAPGAKGLVVITSPEIIAAWRIA